MSSPSPRGTDVPTGIGSLDRAMPLRNGQLYLVGGVPVMGKTTFLVSVALGAATSGIPTTYVAAELARTDLKRRLTAALAVADPGWSPSRAGLTDEDQRKIKDAAAALEALPLSVMTDALPSFREIHDWLRPAGKTRLLLIDDLQSVIPPEKYALGDALRWLARWLRIPVLATIGLDPPNRADPTPVLADFPRELVRSSDAVIALHRREYWEGPDIHGSGIGRAAPKKTCAGLILRDRHGIRSSFMMDVLPGPRLGYESLATAAN